MEEDFRFILVNVVFVMTLNDIILAAKGILPDSVW